MPNNHKMQLDPHVQRTCTAHSKIAEVIGCDKGQVDSVFDWLPSPLASNSEAAKTFKQTSKQILEIGMTAKHLARKIDSVHPTSIEKALVDCEISATKLYALSERLLVMGEIGPEAPIMRSYQGGKNWAAYDIALGIAQIFAQLGHPITFGHDNGVPTTNFGRTVSAALEAFCVKSNWREPARQAAADTKLQQEN